jgi:NAD(P)-dependent dehydrogenase (short-subunit alcohol dehydrogenase family)
VLDFASRNARVILACRDLVKGQMAVDKIQEETGNKNVLVMKLDLSLMKSVREFVKLFKEKETRLDILVNNAGMAGTSFSNQVTLFLKRKSVGAPHQTPYSCIFQTRGLNT